MQHEQGNPGSESAELAALLGALEQDGRYRVERTLKDVGYETTQIVYRTGSEETGPFVRKTFAADSGCGRAYASIFRAQVGGVRFAHQPMIYDVSLSDEAVTVVMEYVRGETLAQLVERRGPSKELAISVGVRLCDALAELHEALDTPIIHRDVKPSNILLSDGRLVLLDLGIAREQRADAQHDTVCFGTPGYAPPEQFGYGQTDVRSDVYAAGMAIAFCLTGRSDNEDLRSRKFCDPEIPGELGAVLAKATEFDPAARYASASEMGSCLRRIACAKPAAAPGGPGERAIQPVNPASSAQVEATSAASGERAAGEAEATGRSRHVASRAAKTLREVEENRYAIMFGRIWNAIVVVLWIMLVALSISATVDPTGNIAQYDFWYRALSYLLILIVPFALVGYLLMYKRDLRRQVKFFSQLNWKMEIPVCAAIIFCSILISVAIGLATGQVT